MPIPDIVVILQENPELLAVVTVAVQLIRTYQDRLSWSEYRTIHRAKRGLSPLVYLFTKGSLHLINDKGGRDDAEFVRTVDKPVRAVVQDLRAAGASLHLLNSIKRRPDERGDPLSAAHVIWTIDGEQVECYAFQNSDGSTDLYAQTEASVDDPMAHLTERVRDGDKHGVLPEAYATGAGE